jgi:hypothetical protein
LEWEEVEKVGSGKSQRAEGQGLRLRIDDRKVKKLRSREVGKLRSCCCQSIKNARQRLMQSLRASSVGAVCNRD